ncbi:hypothetical protein F4780DRAFT_176644 [Xylariomycetidae sp. FL0641]|nr:hypothetical protein F4780DRAFT_176644 [Xylariomycetidae sp. FL0641]
MARSEAVPAKSRRVRTGCLTCRERHLKCDEGTPDCINCRKSNRECKRGVRLNFIDMTCKEPPYIPPTDEWAVHFHDESRLIASEYRGGLSKYAMFDSLATTPPQERPLAIRSRRQSTVIETAAADQRTGRHHRVASAIGAPPSAYFNDRSQSYPDLTATTQMHSRKSSDTSFMATVASRSMGYANPMQASFGGTSGEHSPPMRPGHRSSDISTADSVAGVSGVGPPSTTQEDPRRSHTLPGAETGMMTPPIERPGERPFLDSPEEVLFMQVFVNEVGIWMDSLDREKHFSRQIPYDALKCPMLLNALLACGVKHLTLTGKYSDEKALFYYNTATTQLLRNLQNPERNMTDCAATAVVLNVYEIMSDQPLQRMSHIAGARALVRECGWNAKSTGLGQACFWLNVGMELLSCLAFNWTTAWDPETWGVDMDMTSAEEHGSEEVWVHRIFYIVAKIANFRMSVPKFQEISPVDEAIRTNARSAEWQGLKGMCEAWLKQCPRSMHPYAYIRPSEQTGSDTSLFPNVWLIKRAAIVGRLYYHLAECILAQVKPQEPKDSRPMRECQLWHAHQVCGIVAHTKDRGVASASIRSLAIASEMLDDYDEQKEVVEILRRIDRETGWKLEPVIAALKKKWGWERRTQPSLTAQLLAAPMQGVHPSGHAPFGGGGSLPTTSQAMQPTQTTTPPQQLMTSASHTAPPLAAPRAMRVHENPLTFADFSHPNHPYQNWYEPPSRSNAYSSSRLY